MDELYSLKDNQLGMDEIPETLWDGERGCVWSGMLA